MTLTYLPEHLEKYSNLLESGVDTFVAEALHGIEAAAKKYLPGFMKFSQHDLDVQREAIVDTVYDIIKEASDKLYEEGFEARRSNHYISPEREKLGREAVLKRVEENSRDLDIFDSLNKLICYLRDRGKTPSRIEFSRPGRHSMREALKDDRVPLVTIFPPGEEYEGQVLGINFRIDYTLSDTVLAVFRDEGGRIMGEVKA